MGVPQPGVRLRDGSGPEGLEDLVGAQRLGNDRHDAHFDMPCRAAEGGNFNEFLEQRRLGGCCT